MAGGWRVGLRRVVAGKVEAGLLVLAAPAVLVLGRPAASGRRTWTVVAAAAVVYLRVVAGAMVVAVVVVTVVVKSLGIQSETQQNAGRAGCFAALSGGRESRSGFWDEMAAERFGWTALPGYRTPKSPTALSSPLSEPQGSQLELRVQQSCGHEPFFPGKSAFWVYQHEIPWAGLAAPSAIPGRVRYPGLRAASPRHGATLPLATGCGRREQFYPPPLWPS